MWCGPARPGWRPAGRPGAAPLEVAEARGGGGGRIRSCRPDRAGVRSGSRSGGRNRRLREPGELAGLEAAALDRHVRPGLTVVRGHPVGVPVDDLAVLGPAEPPGPEAHLVVAGRAAPA